MILVLFKKIRINNNYYLSIFYQLGLPTLDFVDVFISINKIIDLIESSLINLLTRANLNMILSDY